MNTPIKNAKIVRLALITLTAAWLSACGTSKSNPTTTTASTYDFNSTKLLANCNKAKDANFSFNTSTVSDQNGTSNSDWIKLKFNFLSSTVTAAGNTVKFFKWRVAGTDSIADSNPLTMAKYELASGSTTGSQVTSINALELNATTGLYIQLNDTSALFQVLKARVFNSAGTVVAEINTLIPGFYSSPLDYQYNSDGTARSITLQQMHALYGADVSSMTQAQMQATFTAFCF